MMRQFTTEWRCAQKLDWHRIGRMPTARIPWPRALSGRYLESCNAFVHEVRHARDARPPTREATLSLREITRENVREIALLDVAEAQVGLVAPNAFSIAQAYCHPEAWLRAVYAGDVPVGFAMLEDWSGVPGRDLPHYEGRPYVALWRFMIDERYQGLGFGSRALQLLIERARDGTCAETMLLSFVPEGPHAEAFYARHGFVNTGVIEDGEVLMMLDLRAVNTRGGAGRIAS